VLLKVKAIWGVTLEPEDEGTTVLQERREKLFQPQSGTSHKNGIVTHTSDL
jgi:hypothetical protein